MRLKKGNSRKEEKKKIKQNRILKSDFKLIERKKGKPEKRTKNIKLIIAMLTHKTKINVRLNNDKLPSDYNRKAN